jgi:hypothetical protein
LKPTYKFSTGSIGSIIIIVIIGVIIITTTTTTTTTTTIIIIIIIITNITIIITSIIDLNERVMYNSCPLNHPEDIISKRVNSTNSSF